MDVGGIWVVCTTGFELLFVGSLTLLILMFLGIIISAATCRRRSRQARTDWPTHFPPMSVKTPLEELEVQLGM